MYKYKCGYKEPYPMKDPARGGKVRADRLTNCKLIMEVIR